MKLIALKNFRNVPSLGLKLADANKNGQIDKGEVFELGDGKDIKSCNNHFKTLIAQLVYAGCAGDASDAKLVEAVKAEVEAEARREAAAKKAAEAAGNSLIVAQLTELLKGQSVKPAEKK